MKFPASYIGEYNTRLEFFRTKAREFLSSWEQQISTGTTIFAMLSEDEKSAIIASDGRVSMENFSMDEEFRKIKECRIGFIGFAGSLGGAQLAVPEFIANLNKFCDTRNRPITASGAASMLFQYHRALTGNENSAVSFLGLFWDFKERKCYLYLLAGGAHIRKSRWVIGSGAQSVGLSYVKDLEPAKSRNDLLARARQTIAKAASADNATNVHMFYGLIENGSYSSGEEVLR